MIAIDPSGEAVTEAECLLVPVSPPRSHEVSVMLIISSCADVADVADAAVNRQRRSILLGSGSMTLNLPHEHGNASLPSALEGDKTYDPRRNC
jgi:hypothetical protein